MIALIPAKSTSQRIKNKNLQKIGGRTLLENAITLAKKSQLFDAVYVSTDSEVYATHAIEAGARVPFMRPKGLAEPQSTDYDWCFDTMRLLWEDGVKPDVIAIIRCTTPFVTVDSLIEGFSLLDAFSHSVRAVKRADTHPGKMWTIHHGYLQPLWSLYTEEKPWHSAQTQYLPPVYYNAGSFEFLWLDTLWDTKSIAGSVIKPYVLEYPENMDINTPYDIAVAKAMLDLAKVSLP